MMNVSAAQKKIKIRHLISHDQEHKYPRQDECHNETEQSVARQLVRCLAENMVFRHCKISINRSQFFNKPE